MHVKPILVTGLGAFTPAGPGLAALAAALQAGLCLAAPAGEALPGAEDRQVALVRDLGPFREAFPGIKPPLPVPTTRLALLAAAEALRHAGLTSGGFASERVGVFLNRGRGPASVVAKIMEPVLKDGPRKMSPLLFAQSVANGPLGAVSLQLGLRGPNLLTLGGGATLLAWGALRRGEADVILCGGLEEVEVNSLLAAERNGILHPDGGPGPWPGEGAIFLVLERADSAAARGARPLARLLSAVEGLDPEAPAELTATTGWGTPRAGAFQAWTEAALEAAGVSPDAVGAWISAANGLPSLTAAEQAGVTAAGITVAPQAPKAVLGEGFGLSGALGLLAGVLAAQAGHTTLVTGFEHQAGYTAQVLAPAATGEQA